MPMLWFGVRQLKVPVFEADRMRGRGRTIGPCRLGDYMSIHKSMLEQMRLGTTGDESSSR